MDNIDMDDFAALAVLAQCLRSSKSNEPTEFVEMNREKVIRRLLDGLALLLTSDPTDKTACSLHFPPDSTDEVTIVIVRREPLSPADRNDLIKVLSDISDFITRSPPTRAFLPRNIGTGSHPDEVVLAKLTFPFCLPRLLDKVGGSNTIVSSQPSIQKIDEIISTLSTAKKIPEFMPHLAGKYFADSQYLYDSESFPKAYTSLCKSLQSFVETVKAVAVAKKQDVEKLYHLVLLAKQISTDKVFTQILHDLLDPYSRDTLVNYMKDLSIYGVALRNIVAMRRTYWRIGEAQRTPSVVITVLNSPASRNWRPPSLSNLLSNNFETGSGIFCTQVNESYALQTHLPLQEHIEMTILSHYISDSTLRPVIYYIGITESPCILCVKFLATFKQQGLRGGSIPNHLWNVKGESGILEGRWLAPSETLSRNSLEIKECMREIKQGLIEEIRDAINAISHSAIKYSERSST